MDISVIIPTYNRSSQLSRTLKSFLHVEIPENVSYELIVIDNNSSDNTAEVVQDFIGSGERCVRYVFEKKQGVSNARNKGFEEAVGDIIACADDDIEFDEKWLIDILLAFSENLDISAITGEVQPVFESGRPDWLVDDYLVVYGLQNYGDHPCPLVFPVVPIEMNVALRRDAIRMVGGYDPRLGRDGKTLLSGEADLFFYLLGKKGGKTLYIPSMKLRHIIPQARVQVEWLVSRYYWSAVSIVKSRQLTAPYHAREIIDRLMKEIAALFKALTNNCISPRKIYWHFISFGVKNKTAVAWHSGSIRQLLVEFLRTITVRRKAKVS